jgi:DNA-binding CsgD family transcriptional regulator
VLHGRDSERARVAALLADARAGTARALLIRGEPGVGKSALLQDARAAAAGMRVLSTQGLESEAPLAFAGLHQLLRPVLSLLERLPAPQARALRVAFGQQDGPTEDPFLVALATLTMLSEAADTLPVLCVVDDAHWLDTASADALLFAARRLQADPVALIFTARDGDVATFTADGVPKLVLTGLTAPAARLLLAEHTGAPLPEQVAQALLAQAGGNPLALVELPTALTGAQLDGTAPIPAQLQLTDRVQRVFLDRCRRLPPEVQTLLLVAAADDSGNLGVVAHAAALLGVSATALPDAERAGLIVTDRDSVRVRHPLVRSGVYQAATGHERRAAHRALADALTDDPDRQAWHQAAAADGPDADVVAALQRAAGRAERRGGYVAAAAAYERAGELSAGDQPRAEMLFAAARNAWSSGQADRARELANAARTGADDRMLRADIDRLLGRIEVNVGSAAKAYRIFSSAARAVAADDPTRAVEIWVAATLTRMFDADTSAGPDAAPIPEQATQEHSDDVARTRCLRLLLAATIADTAGAWAPALRSLHAAVDTSAEVEDPDVLANLGNTALHLGDDQAHRFCFTRMLAGARDRGAGMLVLYCLPRLAFADLLSGDWSRVGSAADEAFTLSADTGQPALGAAPLGWLTLLAALQGRGEYDGLRFRLDDVIGQQHLGVLTDAVHDLSRWAAGVRAANDGDASGALHQLSRLRLPALSRMAAIERLDAAIRAGDRERAQAWLDELAVFAETTRWPWALAAAEHGRALLADPADAPALFDSALAHHEQTGRPYDRARTHLAYGELLRRTQRRSDARPHLRAGLAIFEELGAEPLISRAEQELRASGETARKRDPSTLTLLTPMELQVAQLVARGMSNKEAAAHCWISPRTVAFHLRNVFSKTGVSSRGELAQLGLAKPSADKAAPAAVR